MGKRPPSPDVEAGHNLPPPPPPPGPPPQYYPPPHKSSSWLPFLVPCIFVDDIGVFVYTMHANNCPKTTGANNCVLVEELGRYSFQPVKENPLFGPSANTLIQLGALRRNLVVKEEQRWRLFSCMWLHAGAIHLAVNMISLLFIGIRLEQEFGFLRMGPLYLLSGLGGSLASAVCHTDNRTSVGASGALFGFLGGMLSELITNWSIYANKCCALFTLLIVIGLNLGLTFLPIVDGSAHIGGFIAGFFLGFILLMRPQYGYVNKRHMPPGYDMKHGKKHKFKIYQYALLLISLIVLFLGFGYGFLLLFNDKKLGDEL